MMDQAIAHRKTRPGIAGLPFGDWRLINDR
jgi:hypothetical protein